ncbi:MAG: glycine cleavage system protein GcvH [Spirochaetia bacterium]|nr:glycine cleavage system protein GcvH [Spirochaetia bacterium]MCF7946771.1 glycine cleavage system protein GcvH [Spirochaetia bacterium]MCF7953361.1 glycine cleavage system protein GcvH [Spirochaetales bacterium]
MGKTVKKGLFYTKNHEWVAVDGNEVNVGITDYAQDSLGEIVYVDLPEIDDSFDAEDEAVSIESVKTAAPVYAPFSGTITKVNDDLEDSPERVNEDPYGTFLFVMKCDDEVDTDDLMNDEQYTEYLKTQEDD